MENVELVLQSPKRINLRKVIDSLQAMDLVLTSTRKFKTVEEPIVKKKKCCDDEKKAPNIVERAGSLLKATAEHIITGKKHVKPNDYLARLAICRDCPSIREGFVCIECGCYMGIKASWAEQKCKLNEW